ncbi:hypothetical protein MFIFM68171_08165 [Madurella fahalii]|uniref:Uncharacterized protein n=1 Tax=Madurella fahalii TaxID=1157608 RepID=A0ABQ0GK72_9PEZI
MWQLENDPIIPPLPFTPDCNRTFGAIGRPPSKRASQGYRFGTTTCDYMGMFPKECEQGDLIAIIAGASTPFVLRPTDLVLRFGQCYVRGMMRGELLKPSHHDDVQDAHCIDLWYRIRQRAWAMCCTETVKRLLRRYFNPGVSQFESLRGIDMN